MFFLGLQCLDTAGRVFELVLLVAGTVMVFAILHVVGALPSIENQCKVLYLTISNHIS